MAPKKPTGEIGPITFRSVEAGSAKLSWDRVAFPKDKAEIERFVCQLFVDTIARHGMMVLEATPLPESDFDFVLKLPGGEVYLDLVELVRPTGGNPYQVKQQEVNVYGLAEQLLGVVLTKSQHYRAHGSVPRHLLVYITHWMFAPNKNVIRLVQHWLGTNRHVFENVFFFSPLDSSEGDVRVLFPAKPDPLEGRTPDSLRDERYVLLDPAKFRAAGRGSESGEGD